MPTVIVPAHNEAALIGSCLTALLADMKPQEFDVIVACNGCSDDTAEQARGFGNPKVNVVVLDIAEASKIAALNASIVAARSSPLIFVDADVQFTSQGVRELCEVLAQGSVLAAAPSIRIDLTGSNWVSRSYHRFWVQLPSIVNGLAGRGVYALSEAGLGRLGMFPRIIADDRYIHSLFKRSERTTVANISSTVAVAHTGRDIVNRKTRVFAGNREIANVVAKGDDGSWADVIRSNPRSIIDLPVYLGLNLLAKLGARRSVGWNRDESSRSSGGDGH